MVPVEVEEEDESSPIQHLAEVTTREQLDRFTKSAKRWQTAKFPELNIYLHRESQTVHMHWQVPLPRGIANYIILPMSAIQDMVPA